MFEIGACVALTLSLPSGARSRTRHSRGNPVGRKVHWIGLDLRAVGASDNTRYRGAIPGPPQMRVLSVATPDTLVGPNDRPSTFPCRAPCGGDFSHQGDLQAELWERR